MASFSYTKNGGKPEQLRGLKKREKEVQRGKLGERKGRKEDTEQKKSGKRIREKNQVQRRKTGNMGNSSIVE